MSGSFPKETTTGSRFKVIHCKGATESFKKALHHVSPAQKAKKFGRLIQMQIDRLANGEPMSKESFPIEGDLPDNKGKFNAFKKIPVRGYCWRSSKNPDTYYISHYVYKDYQKLRESDQKSFKTIGEESRRMTMSNNDNVNNNDFELSRSEQRSFCREELIYNVTEDILVILENEGISKKELARRLGKSKSFVTQLLNGSRNMTLGSLSNICFAIGIKPKVKLPVKKDIEEDIKYDHSTEDWLSQPTTNIPHNTIKKYENIIDKSSHEFWRKVA